MRATMRLTWLLLSLGFLFDSSDSDAGATDSTGVTVASLSGATTGNPSGVGTTAGGPSGVGTTVGGPSGVVTTVGGPSGVGTTVGGPTVVTVKPVDVTTTFTATTQHTTAPPTTTVTDKVTTVKPTTQVSQQDPTTKTAPITIAAQAPTAAQTTKQPSTPTNSLHSVTSVPNSPHNSSTSTTITALPGPGAPGPDATTSSKDSGGGGAAGKAGTTAVTPSVNPAQATSHTSPPAGDKVRGATTLPPTAATAATTAAPAAPAAPATVVPAAATTTITNTNTNTNKITTEGKTVFPPAQSTASATLPPATTTTTTTTTAAQPKIFVFSLGGQEKEDEKDLTTLCKRLMENMEISNCTVVWRQHKGKKDIDGVEISGKVNDSIVKHYYAEITKKSGDNTTLIAILASCGALLAMIIGLAIYASHHRKPYNENQQHLTEELHTVENGYHDNPTLEVMEVQPEMQEKKVALNGEFNDSWIVPIDNLLKEEIPDEEDTHL